MVKTSKAFKDNKITKAAGSYFSEKGAALRFESYTPGLAVCYMAPESQAEEVAIYLFKNDRALQFVDVNGKRYHRSMAFCTDIIRR